jgi:lipopolysaccharide export system protein LptC
VMLLAPFGNRGEISFLLAKNSIEVTGQRIRVDQAKYRGVDARGRPFTITAREAVQRSSADPVVRMQGLAAEISMTEGPAQLMADQGNFDPRRDTVMVAGPLRFRTSDGYRLDTGDVLLDLKNRRIGSGRSVMGQLPIGSFSAARMTADLDQRIVRLTGNARLRINQGVIR